MSRPDWCDVGAVVVAAVFAITMALHGPEPRLAGHGCEGSVPGQVLYADEEDAFPMCERIEARR